MEISPATLVGILTHLQARRLNYRHNRLGGAQATGATPALPTGGERELLDLESCLYSLLALHNPG